MVAEIMFQNEYIRIAGDSLTIDSSLKPKPSAGVQVLFRFRSTERNGDQPMQLVGEINIWDKWDEDGELPPDSDNFSGIEHIKQENAERMTAEHIEAFPKRIKAEISVSHLARLQLGYKNYQDMESIFFQEILRAFLANHDVTAKIHNIGGALGIVVTCKRFDVTMFSFVFEVDDREASEQLFEFKQKCFA